MEYRILTVNPGSTSTKVGCFEGEKELFTVNVSHEAEKLKEFESISAQLPYRKETILAALKEADIDLSTIDAFVGRGGGLLAVEGGTYEVNDVLLDHARRGANGVQHPAQLGSQIAHEFAAQYGKPCFVVNPPDTDELTLCARITGIKGVFRNVHLHALNLKETAIRHSKANGWKYEDKNYIVCHIGGGISISAHQKGKMIDGNDIVGGEGPMAPTRCGSIPAAEMIRYCFDHPDKKEVLAMFEENRMFFETLASASETVLCADKSEVPDGALSVILPFAALYLPLADLMDVSAEIARLEKEEKRLQGELKRSAGMLSNEKFLAKAPAAKIEAEKEKQKAYEEQMKGVREELENLRKL